MAGTAPSARLLVVDDKADLAGALADTLPPHGFDVTALTSSRAALQAVAPGRFDLLLTDMLMPEMNGIELIEAARRVDPDLCGVLMTAHATVQGAVQAMRIGAVDYIIKPFRLNELVPVLARALEARRLRRENLDLREAMALFELSSSIVGGLGEAEVTGRVVEAAQRAEGGRVCLFGVGADGKSIDLRAARTPEGEAVPPQRAVALEVPLAEWIEAARGKSGRQPAQTLRAPGCAFSGRCSGVARALWDGEQLIGILCFGMRATDSPLTPGRLRAFGIFAGIAASALRGARLHDELEARVARRTAELEQANRGLEAFAHTVSHDLGAPLRAIGGFTEQLDRHLAGRLDETAQRYFERILTNTRRMKQLIDDLLLAARTSRMPLQRRRVAMRALAEEVLTELVHEPDPALIQVEVGELPECTGSPALLRQVLANLIGNALKYSRERRPAKVTIGGRHAEGETTWWVRDNGVGFEPQYAERLFGVFQRLHSQDEFEGSGVGLSIVAAIVQRHGGRVWAESTPGEGATFYFAIPDPS